MTATEPTGPIPGIPTEPTRTTGTGPTAPTATARTEPTRSFAEPSRGGFRHLAQLIGHADTRGFLNHCLGAEPYRAELHPAAVRALFGWEELNAALAEHRLAPPRLRLEQAGADVTAGLFRTRRTRQGAVLHDLDAKVLNERLRAGATLIVDAVNELHPPLQRLCAGLAAEFGAGCQANLYACWGATQGFDVHWDDHDVFVVQVEGRKRWSLYGSTRAAPTRRDLHADHPRPEAPLETITLAPGDVLYLPRGYWHAAVGLGGPTLHLTIGLNRKTGGDFLHWLADQALAEADVRADLPLEQDDAALGRRLGALLAALARRDSDALARAYRGHVEANQVQRALMSFPAIGRAAEVGPGARVRLAPGVARLSVGPDAVVLRWRGGDYRIAAELAPPLRALVAGETIEVEAMTAAARPDERRLVPAFVAEMVGRGVFVLGTRGDAG